MDAFTRFIILLSLVHSFGVMLQQNGIEDPFPLDATIEYEQKKKLPKPLIATENINPSEKDNTFNYEDPSDDRYNMKEMPEYNVETKADFQGNKEAAEWLMNDPNRFNIMPDKDTKAFFAGEDPDKITNDDPIRLDKQLQENYNDDYSKEATDKQASSLAEDQLSDSDKKIISKAYQMEDRDKENEYSFEGGNKDDFDNKAASSKQHINNDANSNMNSYGDSYDNAYDSYEYDNFNNDDTTSQPNSKENHEPVITITDGDEDSAKDESHNESPKHDGSRQPRVGDNGGSSASKDNDLHHDTSDGEPMVKITNDNDGISTDSAKTDNDKADMDSESKPQSESKSLTESKSESKFKSESDSQTESDSDSKKNSENNSPIQMEQKTSRTKGEEFDNNIGEKNHHGSILPVYRLKHLHRSHEEKSSDRLTTKQPISQPGTSRQNVFFNSPLVTEDPQEMASRLGSFANMMLAKTEEERLARMYDYPHRTRQTNLLHVISPPQEPSEDQSRHGIPSKHGEWNGWSKCSATCSQGTQIRARICLNSPCESEDLYQTRTCTRNMCPDKWRKESLKAHNRLRELHHSPPLVWSNALAKKAKNLANALAAMDYIGSQDLHEEKRENVAQLRTKPGAINELAQKAVDLWSKEENSYSYSYPQLNPSNRHFIQMIWKKTRKLGMASTGSRSGEYTFVVALYGGPGVDHKLLRDNVLRPGRKHDVYTTFKRSDT